MMNSIELARNRSIAPLCPEHLPNRSENLNHGANSHTAESTVGNFQITWAVKRSAIDENITPGSQRWRAVVGSDSGDSV
jgi:hypothetical protein